MLGNLAVWAMNLLVLQGQWDLRTMWGNMSIIAKVVVGILFLLSAWSLGVMIDRVLMYSAARKQSRVFVQQVAGALREGKLDEAISIAERNKKSHIAKVVATGLSEFQSASSQVADMEVIEAAKRGLDRSVAIVHAEMKRGLPVSPPSARQRRSSDCSAPWSASSMRSKALRPPRPPDCRRSPAVFPKRWLPPLLGCWLPCLPCGPTTISPTRSRLSTSKWITPRWSWSTISLLAERAERSKPWHTSLQLVHRCRPPTSFRWPTLCWCC